jgi:exopolysaccharide biosynthesis predicted pyruvyltransferase EpsI
MPPAVPGNVVTERIAPMIVATMMAVPSVVIMPSVVTVPSMVTMPW